MGSQKWQILIESGWCKSCGICVAFCPVKAIVLNVEGKAMAAKEGRCTGCTLCERLCPDLAIQIQSLEATA
ncbi:MAG: 4Fe-4S binding protein [Spirochaetales bacterium]|nr:4Fe-4S binding protein [Spirochaetales bacterium]